MEGDNSSVAWELSKENIQPLKQGRNANVLSVALDDNATQKLNNTRHQFEEELRMYSGDDPLDVWYRYSLWVEQNFPKGGKDGNLKKIIQKCVTSIHGDNNLNEKYKNDGRFLTLWIKYANISANPLEVYSVLEGKGLCTKLAEYYICWSWEVERLGNFRKADSIYQKGFEAGAEPLDVLQDAHKKFQSRVARATVDGVTPENDSDNVDPQRIALTSLKVQGKKNRVANERVGSVVGPAGRVSQSQLGSNARGPGFTIFSDDAKNPVINAGVVAEGGSLPIRSSVNKENTKDPSLWTKAKVGQKTTGIVAVEDVGKYQKPAFAVHADEGASQLGKTPSKLPETSNVLSQRKKLDDWDVPLFIAEPFDPKVQPQYCKHKVYCGTEEFSFEELRGAQYMKREKEERARKAEEQEKKDEFDQMKMMLKKQEEMIQQLLKMKPQQNSGSQQSQQVLRNNPPQLIVTAPGGSTSFTYTQRALEKTKVKDRSNFHDSWISMNKSVTATNASVNVSHFLDESSTCALLQLKPVSLSPLGKGLDEQAPAPNISHHDSSNNSHSNSRGLNLTDPTVNTKMAMNALNDMWSVTLFKEDSIAVDPEPNTAAKQTAPFTIFQDDGIAKQEEPSAQVNAVSQPFEIFCDNTKESNQVPKTTHSFPIFEDNPQSEKQPSGITDQNELYPENQNENEAPAGVIQEKRSRQLAGILQPATNIAVAPFEEEEEKEDQKDNEEKDEDMDGIFPINGTVSADFTLRMPIGPDAFAENAKIVSTPAWFNNKNTINDTVGDLLKDGVFFPEDEEENKEESSGELMPPPSIVGRQAPTTQHEVPKPALSPIMEASREYRSSSSNSSGYSEAYSLCTNNTHGLTQTGHFSITQQSRSRHGSSTQLEWALEMGPSHTGDFTKSGYLGDKSRGESLADSKPNIVPNQSWMKPEEEELTFNPQQAAMMLMEMDTFPVTTSVAPHKAETKDPKPSISSKRNDKIPKLNFPDQINPFDEELLNKLMNQLNEPVESRGGYVKMSGKVPLMKTNSQLTLGQEMFHLRCLKGEGAYAKVFQAATLDPLNVTIFPTNPGNEEDDDDDEHQTILKVQKPPCPWEFYICHELRQRLKAKSSPVNLLDSVMRINRGYFYTNGSILVNEYHKFGTLLDVSNGYKIAGDNVPEEMVMLLMVEVLTIVEALHSCNIIHGDIKPDNILIRDIRPHVASENISGNIFDQSPCSLKLIDFGRSIDMKLFPEGTTFTERVATDGFTCCEMRDGKPWTYQTDYYGIAAIAYCLLFGTYMDVKKCPNGQWGLKSGTMKRYWQRELWQSFFSSLLNNPHPSALSKLKGEIIRTFLECKKHSEINMNINKLRRILMQKK